MKQVFPLSFVFILSGLALKAANAFHVGVPSDNPLRSSLLVSSTTITSGRSSLLASAKKSVNAIEYNEKISSCKEILTKAADTKAEDPDIVLEALEDLEKLMRQKRKEEGESAAEEVLQNLNGDWRLIFTTGTKDTQKRFNTKINYFPIKAVQSFDSTTSPFSIQNGIYAGEFAILKFFGDFDFDLRKSKLEFDFDQIAIFGFKIGLNKDEAAKIGASSGLGSKGNVDNAKKGRKAFFNWISADKDIATARGGGGGLALWKRVDKD